MNTEQAHEIVRLLQVFWPIEWSQRMSKAHEDKLAGELAIMFKDKEAHDVEEAIRYLARTEERPPVYKKIIETVEKLSGLGDKTDVRYAQYIYKRYKDKKGYEYVKQCNVKIYPDGKVELPKGIPWNDRLMRRQDIIDEDGKGIYDFKAHLDKWGPVWKERTRLILEEHQDPKEVIKRVRPENTEPVEKFINDGSVPEGFQQMIDGFLPDW